MAIGVCPAEGEETMDAVLQSKLPFKGREKETR